MEEGEYWKKLSLCYSILYCYNDAQRYEQFTGRSTVSGFDLTWFSSLSSERLYVFRLNTYILKKFAYVLFFTS